SPGRARVRERPPLAAQPRDRTAADQVVELISAQVMADEIAGGGIVGEAVFLHLLREQLGRLVRIECPVEMPLALVRRVVAGLAEDVADRGDLGRKTWLPRAVAVVEHLVVRRLQAGEEDRPRRRAHTGARVVLGERDAGLLQPLMARQGEPRGPLRGVALLVGKNEENVQSLARPAGLLPLALSFLRGLRSDSRPCDQRRHPRSGGKAMEVTPREGAPVGSLVHREVLA